MLIPTLYVCVVWSGFVCLTGCGCVGVCVGVCVFVCVCVFDSCGCECVCVTMSFSHVGSLARIKVFTFLSLQLCGNTLLMLNMFLAIYSSFVRPIKTSGSRLSLSLAKFYYSFRQAEKRFSCALFRLRETKAVHFGKKLATWPTAEWPYCRVGQNLQYSNWTLSSTTLPQK